MKTTKQKEFDNLSKKLSKNYDKLKKLSLKKKSFDDEIPVINLDNDQENGISEENPFLK